MREPDDTGPAEGRVAVGSPGSTAGKDDDDPDLSVKSAQPLDGDFLQPLLTESVGNAMTSIFTVHVPSAPGRAVNTLVAIRDGVIIARYAKLHLYDASAFRSHGVLTLETVLRR